MSFTPSIDYTCPDCGAKTRYELVPTEGGQDRPASELREIPSLDFSCSRCGASGRYTLAPGSGTAV